ncbi:glycoside hydrolase family 3 domain protein [Pelomyxa schiedti]|nr:glycoside hydrolase family 3 domain protein [Pelomyxa schiedti]
MKIVGYAVVLWVVACALLSGAVEQTYTYVFDCNASDAAQLWEFAADGTFHVINKEKNHCLGVEGLARADGSAVWVSPCLEDDIQRNQEWTWDSTQYWSPILSKMDEKCLAIANGNSFEGTLVWEWTYESSDDQLWHYNDDGTFISKLNGLCLRAGTEPLPTCEDYPLNTYDYCKVNLPIAQRASDLVSRMTLDERMSQMVNEAPAIFRLGIPEYDWWTECLHGILTDCGTNCPTSFPEGPALGATFNMSEILEMMQAVSTEGRALHNEGIGGLDYWGPNINLNRDPRWGRNLETPSEDPYLQSQFVVNYIRGMQEGEDTRYLKTVATCKHYAGNSLENWNGYDRYSFDAKISDTDLEYSYLPAFRACITEGRAKSVMCAYNAVNGIPCCADNELLQEILRDEWGFDGYVVSDCDAVSCIMNNHHYTDTAEDTCAVAVKAGTDLDCGTFYNALPSTVSQGKLTEEDINTAVNRLFTQRIQLGMFDPNYMQVYTGYGPELVDSPYHQQLALQIARESMVLLQNNQNLLPLDPSMTVALIGPNADVRSTLLGNYYGERCHGGTDLCVQSVLEAIETKTSSVYYAKGCEIKSEITVGFYEAIKIATLSDVAVMVMGIDTSVESEGNDRYTTTLPGVQEDLIQQVVATGTPVVVVLINGGSLSIEWTKDNVPAILEAFYAGQSAAQAIADVLFGDYNPGGKLPYTVYPAEYVDQIPLTEMGMSVSPGRTYRYYTGTPLWPFGWGLSYTNFTLDWYSQEYLPESLDVGAQSTNYRVNVTNTGGRAGDEVVMAFITENAAAGAIEQLFGFQRVHLEPGESATVEFFTSLAGKVSATNGTPTAVEIRAGPLSLSHKFKAI